MQLPELDHRPTMPEVLRRAAERFGDRDYIVMPDRRLTFAVAEEASRRVGKELLAAGATKGSRIGIMYPYGTEWIVAWLAICRIGAICMPFSTAFKPMELRRAMRLGDVELLLVPPTMPGQDTLAVVEEAVPGLAAAGPDPLRVVELPYLRRIYVTDANDRAWAHPLSLDHRSTTQSAAADGISEALFSAIEAEVTPADLMMTIFTSGTTSEPKCVLHTHGNFLRHGANLARFQGVTEDFRPFCAMPFFWIGGVGLPLNWALHVGHPVLCVERFESDTALDLMEAEGANFLGIWSQLGQKLRQYIAATGRDVSGIPAFAPPPPGTPTTTDLELKHNSLGMSETVGPHSGPGPEAARVLPEEMRGSFGPLVPYVEHRIADPETNATVAPGEVGEVCIRGYSLMAGLYKKERWETFDDDGWYHTGDKGQIRDGYLYFLGRISEMIKTSGSNVAPREVESTIESFPEVALAVVLGVPDAERGEIVTATVMPRPGATLDALELVERIDKELSGYKVPRKVLVLEEDEMPFLPNGKPDKLRLRALLAEAPLVFPAQAGALMATGSLAGKVALVAGGASGIGAATARALAARGATVVVGDREHAAGEAVAAEVGGTFVPLDVTDEAAWAAVPPVDLAYISAGVMTQLDPCTLADLTPAAWARVRAVNVDGAMHGLFHLVPGMAARGRGAVVLTGSLAGLVGFADDPFYGAAKALLIQLARSMAGPLAEAGVRINVICPGEVATAMLPEQRATFLAGRGHRPLRPDEVAEAVVDTLEGDDTGQVFTVVTGRAREAFPEVTLPRPLRDTAR